MLKDYDEDEYNVDLSLFKNFLNEIQEKNLKKEDYSPELINELVSDCKKHFTDDKFHQLMLVIFVAYDIKLKILDTVKSGNFQYLSEDDYFQLYSFILWEAITTYDESVGDFKNYFIFNFRVKFLEQKKQSFFRIHGNVVKDKRTVCKCVNIDSFSETAGVYQDFDDKIFFENIHKYVDELPQEYACIIEYTFFSNPCERRNITEVCEHFNLSKNQVNYRISRGYELIRNSHPTALEDFYYERKGGIIEFPDADAFKNNKEAA